MRSAIDRGLIPPTTVMRASTLFTDIHRYSPIFTDIHRVEPHRSEEARVVTGDSGTSTTRDAGNRHWGYLTPAEYASRCSRMNQPSDCEIT